MVQPSPSYTVALYLEVPASQKAVARLVDTATATGAIVTGVDVADSDGDKLTVNLTADTRDSKHRNELVAKLEEIDGVVSLANTYAPIKSLLKRGSIGRPIQISLNDDVAVIDISVNLKYGANIPQVAEALQKTVKDAVQNMTGITVSKVNVHVAGIVFPQTAPATVEE